MKQFASFPDEASLFQFLKAFRERYNVKPITIELKESVQKDTYN